MTTCLAHPTVLVLLPFSLFSRFSGTSLFLFLFVSLFSSLSLSLSPVSVLEANSFFFSLLHLSYSRCPLSVDSFLIAVFSRACQLIHSV